MRRILVLTATLAGVATQLQAQHAHQYEIGAFGSYTRYDAAFNLANRFGGGARFGYFLADRIGLEGDVLFQPEYNVAGGTTIEPLIGGGSLVINLLSGARNLLYVLGGYSRLDFGNSSPYKFTDNAVHGGVGDRIFLTNRLALRLEGRVLYTPTSDATAFGKKSPTHFVGTVGLSLFQLGRQIKDSDKDGVDDSKDKCPNTPLGAHVDANGCPIDSDGDGVPDGIDQCPNTPAGATVDAKGCPVDSDGDGVPDGIDKCPNTPPGTAVDATGCPISKDSDGDGVPDDLDKCPNTPIGATVDATGCPIDSDHDGVPDGIDKCPNTPIGATVDATGCPSDSDGDGVPDGIDKCPNTPPGTPVDATGCPISKDSDGDGVPDDIDKCPNTPPGTVVDATGCPVQKEVIKAAAPGDEDGDGVPDDLDKCPHTPPGSKVDAQGCIVLFAPTPLGPGPKPRPTLVLRGVNFETGKSALTPDSYIVLAQVAEALVANPEVRIEIAGYTDNTGSAVLNRRLSLARASAVRAYLAAKGVSPTRMTARGFGPGSPVAPNTTAAGRAQNRRVELHKLP